MRPKTTKGLTYNRALTAEDPSGQLWLTSMSRWESKRWQMICSFSITIQSWSFKTTAASQSSMKPDPSCAWRTMYTRITTGYSWLLQNWFHYSKWSPWLRAPLLFVHFKVIPTRSCWWPGLSECFSISRCQKKCPERRGTLVHQEESLVSTSFIFHSPPSDTTQAVIIETQREVRQRRQCYL